MQLIFICSPYAGQVEANLQVARTLCRAAIDQGYAPIAPHLIYPQILDDSNPQERERGLQCSKALMEKCDLVGVLDVPLSPGMSHELYLAGTLSKKIMLVDQNGQPSCGSRRARPKKETPNGKMLTQSCLKKP